MTARHYDYLIVGAGSSGCVLAERLSRVAERRVLVVEAGPVYSGLDEFPAEVLASQKAIPAFPGHPLNWSFVGHLTEQLAYSIPRGRVMGGSSSINGTYYIRGRKTDFDRWAALGNSEWSYDKVLPSFVEIEDDVDFPGAPLHGGTGPVRISRDTEAMDNPVVSGFFDAARSLGFGDELDKNGEEPEGVGLVPRNVEDGVRVNAALSHLVPAMSRSNLDVRGDTFVRRVVVEGTRAVGVEVEADGRVSVIRADEIILSAGSVKTPHLLMLSGIGDAADLAKAGIDVRVDLRGVGRDFVDHPHINVGFTPLKRRQLEPGRAVIPAGINFTASSSSMPGDLEIVARMAPFGGMMVAGTSSASYVKGALRIMARPLRTIRSMRGVSMRRVFDEARHQGDLSLNVALQQGESRGQMTIESPDPSIAPRVEYHYLSEPEDVRRLGEGIRMAVDVLESPSMRSQVARRTSPPASVLASDRALEAWMRRALTSAIHLSCSARMGPDPDEGAVVDDHCRVYGVEGLRVVDTSIMPYITSRGTAATALMLGDRAARLIDADAA